MPFNITMPDGNVIAGVPEGTTQSQLSTKYQSYQQPKQEAVFGSNRGVAPPTEETRPTPEAAINTAKTLVTAAPAAVLNAGKTVGALETGQPDQPGLDTAVTSMNQTREGWMQGNPAAKAADIAGQAAVPIGGEAALFGKGAEASTEALRAFSLGKWVKQIPSTMAKGAAYGAIGQAESPQDNQTRSQILSNEANSAVQGMGISGALHTIEPAWYGAKGVGSYAEGYLPGSNYAKEQAQQAVDLASGGKAGNAPLQQGIEARNQFNQANPNATINPTAGETALMGGGNQAGGGLLDLENSIKGTGPLNTKYRTNADYEARNEANKEAVATKVEGINPENANPEGIKQAATVEGQRQQAEITRVHQPAPEPISKEVEGAMTPVEAQTKTGAVARDISNVERQSIKDAYTAVAPDETVKAPLEALQADMDGIREKSGGLISEDKTLSEIDNRYSTENEDNTAPVKQLIQDKNALGDYINTQYKVLKNPNAIIDADTSKAISDKIAVAQQMRDAIKGHITSLDDVPSGVEGKSVSEAFTEAEGKYKDYQQKYLENPEQYKVNAQGQQYGRSSSAFGDYDYRLQKGTAGGLAEEGKKVLPIENPAALGSALKNIRNYQDADGLVKTNLLAAVKDKGFDKVLTPDVVTQLEQNGFEGVSKDLQDIRSTLESQKATTEQRNALIDRSRQFEQDKLEKSFAGQFLKDNNADVGKLLKDKDFQQQALDLAAKQDDGGATTRGIGKTILDGIKEDSKEVNYGGVSEQAGKGLEFPTQYNSAKLNAGIVEHEDVLRQTLGDKTYESLQDAGNLTRVFDAANTISKELGETGSGQDKATESILKGLSQKGFSISYSALNSVQQILNKFQDKKIAGFIDQMISDPELTLKAKLAVQNADKSPSTLSKIISNAWEIGQQVAPIAGKPTYEKPTEQAPQSNKETPNANNQESFLSQFSPVSNANASELPPGVESSKKNNEFQIAQVSKQTGMPKEYFDALEKAETSNIKNPDRAKNNKSTAYGRSQFTESTWNDLADEYDLPPITDKNRYTKDDPRSNPKYSRLAAGYYGADNADNLRPWIQSKFGRDATIGDVYGAHLMGLSGIKQFLSADPEAKAADIVPAAAKNNKSLFYGKDGNPLSIRQVYRNIEDRLMPESKDITGESDMTP